MQRVFANFKQNIRRQVLLLAAIALLLVSGLFISQPSYAATPNQKLIQQEQLDKASQVGTVDVEQRERAYEEQVEASKDIDKTYEDNLKDFKKSHPEENIVTKAVEGAKEAVDKVTK
jgi:Na+-transporting NADH:ubiquinone oxidoreductase subunit NqrC